MKVSRIPKPQHGFGTTFFPVSISSNLIQEALFLCNPNPRDLVSSFIGASENLATQSKAQTKKNFLQFGTLIKSRLARILETLSQCRIHCVGTETEDNNSSTQFLQLQKNQLIDLQKHFERYCNTLPMFGCNSATYDSNFIKSYLLSSLVSEQDVEPIVIQKNQSVCFVPIW